MMAVLYTDDDATTVRSDQVEQKDQTERTGTASAVRSYYQGSYRKGTLVHKQDLADDSPAGERPPRGRDVYRAYLAVWGNVTGGQVPEPARVTQTGHPYTPKDRALIPPLPPAADELSGRELVASMNAVEQRAMSAQVRHWNRIAQQHPLIQVDAWVHSGQPVIRGTRIPVSVVMGYMTLGPGKELLLKHYPDLDEASIKAAVDFTLALLGE